MRTNWIYVVLLCLAPAIALADDDCDAVLNKQLMDSTVVINKSYAASALANAFCNKSYREARSAQEIEGGLNFKGFGLDIGDSESSFDSWKQENCASGSSSQREQSSYYYAYSALPREAIRAWETCKTSQYKLVCSARKGASSNMVTVVVNWNPPGTQESVVVSSWIDGGVLAPDDSSELFEKNSKLFPGRQSFNIKRTSLSDLTVTLNIRYGDDIMETCDVFAPSKEPKIQRATATPAIKRFSIVGQWCIANQANARFEWKPYKDGYMEYAVYNNQLRREIENLYRVIYVKELNSNELEVTYIISGSIAIVPTGQAAPPTNQLRKRIVKAKVIGEDMLQYVSGREEGFDGQWRDLQAFQLPLFQRCKD